MSARALLLAEGPCKLWQGGVCGNGYGLTRRPGERKMLGAHRRAWELARGAIPPGTDVLHRCDNPLCVNVNHLFLGTDKDNAADRDRKGRAAVGERNGNARLTVDRVREIRHLLSFGKSQSFVARLFGVCANTIRHIAIGRNWKHLDSGTSEARP